MTNNRKKETSKRLFLTLLLMIGVTITGALVIYALRSNIDFFYTPRDVIHGKNGVIPSVGQRMQVGGMVMPDSVKKDPDSLTINFVVYDKDAEIAVYYSGILPDLFEEGQSVVIKGVLEENLTVKADTILAKHDENYTPPEVEEAMGENHMAPADRYRTTPQGLTL